MPKRNKNNKASGNSLHKKAKKYIPGGNSLLSKRREMFAPNQWPAYFESAKKELLLKIFLEIYLETLVTLRLVPTL